jgi:hypothetical protein
VTISQKLRAAAKLVAAAKPRSADLEAWGKSHGLRISKIQIRNSFVKGTLSKGSITKLLSLKSTLPGWKLTEGYGTPGKDNYAWSLYAWNDPEYGPMRMHHERSRASVPSYVYMGKFGDES